MVVSILWRIEPLLSSDSVNSGRCWVTPAICTHVIIEEWCFLCGPRRDRFYATVWYTRVYNNKGALFSAWSVRRSYFEEN
jgi:hypothetical protein